MAQRILLATLAICVLVLCLLAPEASAHGGGLNAEGCHTNRKTGNYHCHRSSASPAARPSQAAPSSLQPPSQRPSSGQAITRPFRNCGEARAAGAAPVRRGEPGYGPHLDRDNDGIGCE